MKGSPGRFQYRDLAPRAPAGTRYGRRSRVRLPAARCRSATRPQAVSRPGSCGIPPLPMPVFKRTPIKIGIDLSRREQMLQLFQPRETSEQEHLLGHSNPLEDRAQLARAELGRPATGEIGQVPADLAERGAIAAIVAAWPAETDATTVKDLPDDRGDFANPVILAVIADVENLVVYRLARRFESEDHGLADVLDMDQRSPRRTVTCHPDLFGGPGEPGEVIENNVEPHSWAGAECSGIAQKYRREMGVGERADITLDQHLAPGVSGLRVGRRLLVAFAAVFGGP